MYDAQELKAHLELTCPMIRRHRARMMPGGIGYQDNPTFGGFGPKLPYSLHAQELGDAEAAFVGNLARYCMAYGTVPRRPLKGFWWVNGVCKGVKGGMDEDEFDFYGNLTGFNYLHDIQFIVDHLSSWASQVLKTEGVDELIRAGQETRWYSLKMFPQEDTNYLSEKEALEYTGRSKKTLWEWRKSGSVECTSDNWGIMYERSSLDLMLEIKRGNSVRSGVKNITAGR